MAFVAIDPFSKKEYLFSHRPYRRQMRDIDLGCDVVWLDATRGQLEHEDEDDDKCMIELPDGSIYKLIGKELTINDEPIKLI